MKDANPYESIPIQSNPTSMCDDFDMCEQSCGMRPYLPNDIGSLTRKTNSKVLAAILALGLWCPGSFVSRPRFTHFCFDPIRSTASTVSLGCFEIGRICHR